MAAQDRLIFARFFLCLILPHSNLVCVRAVRNLLPATFDISQSYFKTRGACLIQFVPTRGETLSVASYYQDSAILIFLQFVFYYLFIFRLYSHCIFQNYIMGNLNLVRFDTIT